MIRFIFVLYSSLRALLIILEQNRSWESAKNRFLRTIFKNLHKFRLSADIIKKFERGAVVQSIEFFNQQKY
jgi:hypothetical protein